MLKKNEVEDLWTEWDDKNKRTMTLQPLHFDWMDALETITALYAVAEAADNLTLMMRTVDQETNPCYLVELEQTEKALSALPPEDGGNNG
jgi:hypothetical protein